jgi:hypothetical protein
LSGVRINDVVDPALVKMVRSHPAARDVNITLTGLSSFKAWVDAKKLQ